MDRAVRRHAWLMRIAAVALVALSTTLWVCSCASSANDDDCEGIPWGAGYTLSPGPPIHDGYYSKPECEDICSGFSTCAPVHEQRGQPRYRCGAPPPASCGPRHTPRPNVRGPCDSDGFDIVVTSGEGGAVTEPCGVICGASVSTCRVVATLPDGRGTFRCGEELPVGCTR